MKILLLLPLLLGFSVPAIAHNEANGGCGSHCDEPPVPSSSADVPCTLSNYIFCNPFKSESDE